MKLIYEVKDRIARITINRPEAMNAMDADVYAELSRAWIDVRDNPEVWIAIVTGAGDKAFTAGADLKSFIPGTRGKADFWLTQKNMILNRGLEVWKPIIAAVNGYCLAGGMTLLFATDIRIAAEHAVFEISEVKRGILPGNGGTQRALRQLPYAIAMEMLLLGRRLTAHEALSYGLINKMVPLKDLVATAEEYARRLCDNGPLALRAVKELAIRSQSVPPDQEKAAARPVVKAGIKALAKKGQGVSVRVNGFATGLTLDDLEGVLCPELQSITLPKVETPADMHELDALLTHLERRLGIPVGTIATPLGCETAKAMRNVYEIVTQCRRVTQVTLAAGPGGDAARAIGYAWSREGTETLYLRAKVLLDARAAGVQYPTISSWWNIKDLEGLERDAKWNRQLGYRGQTVMHPSHVPIVNAVFTPPEEEIAFHKGLTEAMQDAQRKGIAAVT